MGAARFAARGGTGALPGIRAARCPYLLARVQAVGPLLVVGAPGDLRAVVRLSSVRAATGHGHPLIFMMRGCATARISPAMAGE